MKALVVLLLLTFLPAAPGAEVYRCPMKCEGEKTYAKPGKCPKCGMPFIQAGAPFKVRMELGAPDKIEPGKTARLTFTPKSRADGSVFKDLDIVHEKKLHLFLVSQDLSWFDHVHPEPEESGRFVLDAVFPAPGNFVAIGDYTPKGAHAEVSFHPLQVIGAAPSPKPLVLAKQWKGDDFAFRLELPKKVKAGKGTTVTIRTLKAGKPVEGLENYLGALGHCVAIHEDLSEYFHAHPPHGEAPKQVSSLEFHGTFPKPGKYKVWMQFQHGGKVRTSEFVVQVP